MEKFLIPREGVIVRDPSSFSPLPVDGMLVDWNGNAGRFWRRRVSCGDAYIGEPKKKVVEVNSEILETTSPNKKQRGK